MLALRGAAPACVLLAGLLLAAGARAAPVYQWKDENGNTVFSQQRPPAGRKAERISPKTGRPAADAAEQLSKSRAAFAPPPPKEEPALAPLTPAQQAQRAAACAQAREALEILQGNNRPRYEAPDGQLIVLDDALKAARIADAEQKIGEYCDQ